MRVRRSPSTKPDVSGTVPAVRSRALYDRRCRRLAIRADVRGVFGLGAGLVHRAVATAIERGCDVFSAHVQRQNVGFFRRLHWEAIEEREIHGHPHMLMRADLDAYRADGFARLERAS